MLEQGMRSLQKCDFVEISPLLTLLNSLLYLERVHYKGWSPVTGCQLQQLLQMVAGLPSKPRTRYDPLEHIFSSSILPAFCQGHQARSTTEKPAYVTFQAGCQAARLTWQCTL
jgi:hypothetical protein